MKNSYISYKNSYQMHTTQVQKSFHKKITDFRFSWSRIEEESEAF